MCVPLGNTFLCSGLLCAQVKPAERLRLCDAQLLHDEHNPTQDPSTGGQAGDGTGGLEQVPGYFIVARRRAPVKLLRQGRFSLGKSVLSRSRLTCAGGVASGKDWSH